MNPARILAWAALFALVCCCAKSATASTVKSATLDELTAKSNAIVMGKVLDVTSRWDDNHREIYSYCTLRILDRLKGMKGESTVTLRLLGGEVGDVGSSVPGMPRFRKDEQVVVFLSRKDPEGYPWVVGLQQGKFSISTDENGSRVIRNDLVGLQVVGPKGSEATGLRAVNGLALPLFLDRVRASLKRAGDPDVKPLTPVE